MTVSIREARGDDAGAVAELFGQLGHPVSEEQVARRLSHLFNDNARLFVAASDTGLVGLLGLHIIHLLERDDPVCMITAFIVGATEEGHETGRRLMGIAEHVARQQGCFSVMTNAGNNRRNAQTFYQQLGYKQTGQRFVKKL